MKETEASKKLREEILEKVEKYYEMVHAPRPYVAGERVGYAGRVFDAREMTSLTDAALDFWLTAGPHAETFEKQLAKFMGLRHALLVNSGSSANLLAFFTLTSHKLKDRAIKPGDEVITVAAGFPTTVTPILQFGARPVFLDVDLATANVDVSQLEAALSDRTRAVMIAHTLGNPFDLGAVESFCEKHDLWLIEDNCDALGSTFNGQLTGTFGDLATSSFYPPHHITMGEGGAVYTDKALLKSIAESFRDWGRDCWCPSGKDNTCAKRFEWQLGTLPEGYDHKYIYSHFGFNLKATDLQAAIGNVQLNRIEEFAKARARNWQTLHEALRPYEDRLILPEATPNSQPSWFGFLMTRRENAGFSRTEIVNHMEAASIQTRMLFAGNLTRHPCFDPIRGSDAYRTIGDLPNTDRIMNDSFWLGVYPGLTDAHMNYVIETITAFLKQ